MNTLRGSPGCSRAHLQPPQVPRARCAGNGLQGPGASAFSRIELVVVLGVLVLISCAAFPLLAQTRSRTHLAVCLNNLRQIGRAILIWNADHGNHDPWRLSVAAGGVQDSPSGLQQNSWFQFQAFSNELRSPKVLACPSDSPKRPASDFTLSPITGFLNASFRNNSVSYLIGLDSMPHLPDSVVAGDRNIASQGPSSCSSGLRDVSDVSASQTQWTVHDSGKLLLHGAVGNILFHDGRVEQHGNEGLRQSFVLADDNGSAHVLKP